MDISTPAAAPQSLDAVQTISADVLREMQKRTDVILRLGGTFKDDYAERLRGVGISL